MRRVAVALVALVAAGLTGGVANAAHISTAWLSVGGERGLVLSIADTQAEREQGFRGVKPRRRHGILFVHALGPAPGFTMAGVRHELVALHVDASGTVLARALMRPCRSGDWRKCPVYPSPVGTRMTIEALPADVERVHVGRRLLPESLLGVVGT